MGAGGGRGVPFEVHRGGFRVIVGVGTISPLCFFFNNRDPSKLKLSMIDQICQAKKVQKGYSSLLGSLRARRHCGGAKPA